MRSPHPALAYETAGARGINLGAPAGGNPVYQVRWGQKGTSSGLVTPVMRLYQSVSHNMARSNWLAGSCL